MRRRQFICKNRSFLAASSNVFFAASAPRSRSASPSPGNKSGGHQLLTSSYSFMLRLLCLSRSFACERIPSQEGSNKNEAIKVSSFAVMTPVDRQPRTSSPVPCTRWKITLCKRGCELMIELLVYHRSTSWCIKV